MAFDYQSLKELTEASVVDATIADVDIADATMTTNKFVVGSLNSGKFASSAVNVSSSTATGTLPVARGGTGLSSLGGAFRAITSNGSSLSYDLHGIQGIQVFTGTSTWTRPTGVRYIRVQLLAGGGGGSGHGEGGGAGGYCERYLDVTSISSVNVSIGGGGGGTYYANRGGNGAGSSFGPYLSAQGGHGANRQNQHSGGVSGGAGGGNLNIHQGGGICHHSYSSQAVSNTYFGGGAPSSHPQGGHFAHNHQNHCAPGTGGAGAHFHGHRGSDGRPGICVVTSYY